MADNRVRLVHEIDASQSIAAASQVEQRWTGAHANIDKGIRGTAQHLQRAATVASAAIGAMTSGVAASQRSWLSLGTSVLAAFAAGGPVAGGIAVVAAGVGLLASSGREFEQEMAAIRAGTAEVEKKTKDLDAAWRQVAMGIDPVDDEIASINEKLEKNSRLMASAPKSLLGEWTSDERSLRQLGEENNALNNRRNALLDFQKAREREINDDLRTRIALLREEDEIAREALKAQTEAQKERASALAKGASESMADALLSVRLDEIERARNAAGEARAKPFFDAMDQLERENRLLAEQDPKRRALLQIEQQIAELRERANEAASKVGPRFAGQLDAAIEERERLLKGSLDSMFPSELEKFRKNVGPQLSAALSDAVIDGFRTGFDNAGDIARNFTSALLSQLLNLAITAGLRGIGLGSLFGSAQGNVLAGGRAIPFASGGVVDRPTLFPMRGAIGLTGEAGPEAVMPLRRTSSGRLGVEAVGGGGTTIHFNGLSVSRDFLSMPESEQERIIGRAWSAYMRRHPSGKRVVAGARSASLQ